MSVNKFKYLSLSTEPLLVTAINIILNCSTKLNNFKYIESSAKPLLVTAATIVFSSDSCNSSSFNFSFRASILTRLSNTSFKVKDLVVNSLVATVVNTLVNSKYILLVNSLILINLSAI